VKINCIEWQKGTKGKEKRISEYLSKPNLNAFLKKIDLNLSMLYQEVLAVLS